MFGPGLWVQRVLEKYSPPADRYPGTGAELARQLLDAGWEIGSHTRSHPDLRSLAEEEVKRELSESRAMLEQQLDTTVESFAYPYGRCNDRVRDLAAMEYRDACTTRLARHLDDEDPLLISRIDMYYMRDLGRFSRLLDGKLDAWCAARRLLRAARGALQ